MTLNVCMVTKKKHMHLEFFFSEKESNSRFGHCIVTNKPFFITSMPKQMGKHAFQQRFNIGTLCEMCLVNLKTNNRLP